MRSILIILTALFFLQVTNVAASDIESIVRLTGYWKFNIGDDMAWAEKDFDDSQWDRLYAPGSWEDQGYVGYNGYAWYRNRVEIPAGRYTDQLTLNLGRIDDVNEVYFNGTLVGQTGMFPPNFQTAYNVPVTYSIPKYLINENGENTIAVRVYDEGREGGLLGDDMALGYDRDIRMLSQNLAGNWKIEFSNFDSKCRMPGFDDSEWKEVYVPATWESQGYNHYDGQAVYRKEFRLKRDLITKRLYLVLGKIDDEDSVYLNGKLIGKTKDMYNTRFANRFTGDWQIRRAYEVPEGLLNVNGTNTLAVVVYDHRGEGGIYEGPVGFMTQDAYAYYLDKYEAPELFPGYHFLRSLFFD
ncbi:beta galactosidase jelly roll domain-containing protein [Marinilabilia rubra]|uniref:Glycoside hydrolase n=1 Tax=Marinilabilia rubra TaxID=2162893 RepID=A0A2U2B4T2_9BACT|nr:beta galactosidase jelly roll domain-containing protein [Marinilabilia rubra]PWD98044.1 glycoside hydrolase [Marinilabilia rubra]